MDYYTFISPLSSIHQQLEDASWMNFYTFISQFSRFQQQLRRCQLDEQIATPSFLYLVAPKACLVSLLLRGSQAFDMRCSSGETAAASKYEKAERPMIIYYHKYFHLQGIPSLPLHSLTVHHEVLVTRAGLTSIIIVTTSTTDFFCRAFISLSNKYSVFDSNFNNHVIHCNKFIPF